MDFHLYAVIIIVFLVSFFTLLFISKLPRGKTFDEVLAEKRQLAEKLYGPSNRNHANKQMKSKKNNNQKKGKQSNKSNNNKDIKENTATASTTEEFESDGGNSEENGLEHTGGNTKGHVEFLEAEVIPNEPIVNTKKSSTTTSTSKSNSSVGATASSGPTKRKNSKSPGPGILINRTEATPIKNIPNVKQLNHFEEILPKDYIELKKEETENIKDSAETHRQTNGSSKEHKKGKHKREIVEPGISTTAAFAVTTLNGNFSQLSETKVEKFSVAPQKFVQENGGGGGGHHHHKNENSNNKSKKKKNEFDLVQKLMDEREGININFLIPILSKAELTRNEIQILIDFLLNKQQDTVGADHSEWSEGKSDVLQKLKKQLAEKEKALQDEQDASAAIQAKLRELRGEINYEKGQLTANIKLLSDQLKNKNLELQNYVSEVKFLNDKFQAEKQTLTAQLQQIQAKYMQEKKAGTQEVMQQVQQLTETNNALKNELVTKNAMIMELQHKYNEETFKKIGEYEKKFSEYEIMLRKKDEQKNYLEQELNTTLQRVQEMKNREAELTLINVDNQRLRADLCRKENLESMLELQKFEYEKLKQQLNEQVKSVHMDDTNKVEIRNLQNALDSSRQELTEYRSEANDNKKIVDDLNTQVKELKATLVNLSAKNNDYTKEVTDLNGLVASLKLALDEKEAKLKQFEVQVNAAHEKEVELLKLIEEGKQKNDELRKKNWKLIEGLQNAESNAVKLKNNGNIENGEKDTQDVIVAEQKRIIEQIGKLLPDSEKLGDTNHNVDSWISNLVKYVQHLSSENKSVHLNMVSGNSVVGGNILDNSGKYQQLLLQNEKLQESLENSRRIMTETEKMLNNLERNAEEREVYWQGVVDVKNIEIDNLKSNSSQVAEH